MNGYERIKAAFNGEKSEQVPIMLHNFMMAAHEYGVTMEEYRNDPNTIARVFIHAIEKYEYDGVLIDIDTATLAGAVGVPVDYPENEPARCISGLVKNLEQVQDLRPVNIQNHKQVQVWLQATSLLREYFGNDIYIRGNCDQCPYSLASLMRSPAMWMMDLLNEDNQDLVFQLLDYCTAITSQFIDLMVEAGAHMVSNGDSPAGPDMISPDMYRQFAFPYEKQIVAAAEKQGVPYVLHICGDTSLILADMVHTGAHGLELDYKTDARLAHDLLKDKVVFLGNIDPSGVLATGTKKDVIEKTEELLTLFADTPRFILNAGCAIPAETPSENLKAMIDTARHF